MAEVLFVLTTIFVAYVVYVVVGDQMSEMKAMASKDESKPAQAVTQAAAPKIQAVAEKPAVQAAAAKEKPAARKPAASPTASVTGGLKNPATGEVANMPNNYRFAKRWIKEALVKEGLLDKVYKNNELDDKANAKIKRALNKLAKMDQYQA
ncbi:MAG: hypothetical protein ACU85E_03050 [Gammaproteobacteria bacterium]